MGLLVVFNALLRLSTACSVTKLIAIQSQSCQKTSKSRQLLVSNLFREGRPQNFYSVFYTYC